MLSGACIFEEIQSDVTALPSKLNFKIGEAAKILGVQTHVLRYWEEEFSLLKPKKFQNNQRLYFKKDMEILFLIKNLLYEEKLSVEGVRKHLSHFYRQFSIEKSQQINQSQEVKKGSKIVKKELKSLLTEISSFRSKLDGDGFI